MKLDFHACLTRYLTRHLSYQILDRTSVVLQNMAESSDTDVPQMPAFLPSADAPADCAALFVFVCIT